MSLQDIKSQIVDFYNDSLFQKLNAYYGKTTIFNIFKIERNENRHSAFLAWLLDKNGSHGLGDEPIKKFMRLIAKGGDSNLDDLFLVGNYDIEKMEVETETQVEDDKHSKKGRIDVYAKIDYKEKSAENSNLKRVHIILENKIYTNEHDDQTKVYYEWASREFKRNQIICVFLSPTDQITCSCDKFIKITYDDLLIHVIEPLLMLDMSDEARVMISDYVINLGQPLTSKSDGNAAGTGEDTILAVSSESKESFLSIYENNKELLDAALYAECNARAEKQLKMVFSDTDRFSSFSQKELDLLKHFWTSNQMLLKMTLNAAFAEKVDDSNDDNVDDYQKAVGVMLRLNTSNRDTTKYLVYSKDGSLMNEDKKPVPKSVASYYIFKAWAKDNPSAGLDDIRRAFPVETYAQHYITTFQYLFYKKEDITKAIHDNTSGHDYVIARMDEDDPKTYESKKYLKWDFFTGKNANKYYLSLNGTEVLSVKMWHKNEFDLLLDKAKKYYSIRVVEQ